MLLWLGVLTYDAFDDGAVQASYWLAIGDSKEGSMDERDWILERSRSSTYTFSSSSSSIRQSSFHPSNQPSVSPAPHFACNSLHIMILQPIVEASYLAHSQTSSQLSKNQESSRNHASEACFEFESLCCMPWNDGSFVVSKELLKRCGGEAFLGTARASLRRGCLL